MSFCPKCGKQNRDGVKFCASCGTPIQNTFKQAIKAPAPSQSSPGASSRSQNSPSSSDSNQSVFIQLIIVAAVCAVLPLALSNILGWPVRWIKGVLPEWNCIGIVEGSAEMYLCSMRVGLLTIAPPVLIMLLIFMLRKVLSKGVSSLNNKIPANFQYILPAALATMLFTIAWAGYHASTLSNMGIVPNRVFPVFVGLFTYAVIRFGPSIQNSMSSFFRGRDKVPGFFRYVLVIAVPMGIALLITRQQIVSQEALKEQFVVIVGLVLAYLLVSPIVKQDTFMSGLTPSSRGFAGRAAAMLVLGISGGFLARLVLDLLSPEIAFAGDCSEEWDCQQTAGYNAATATGGAAIGGISGAIGAQLGGGLSGGSNESDGTIPVNYSDLVGGPGDNPYTQFFRGQGPSQCPPGSVPMGLPNYWINTATLDLVIQDTIFICQGLGPALNFTLTYNSKFRKDGMFGNCWRMSFESTVEQNQGNIALLSGSGQELRYKVGQSAATPSLNQPVEAVPGSERYDRLLDYGRYWLFVEKETRLLYRYDKLPGSGVSRLTAIYDRNGNVMQINYNSDGNIASVVDAVGRSFNFTIDNNKRCTVFSLPDGRKAIFAYDSFGNLVESRDLQDIPSIYEYDNDRFINRIVLGNDRKTTSFMYQGQGQRKYISAVTDAAGNTTKYERSPGNSGSVTIVNPKGGTYGFLSRNGITEKVIDPTGKTITYGYARGRRVSVQGRNGQTTRTEYDGHGNMVSRIDALGRATVFKFDENDNLISETNPQGETWQFRYDNRGNLTSFISPTGRVFATEYDTLGQAIAHIDGNGGRTSLSYDRFGNLESAANPMGHTTKFSHDPHGLVLTAITDARGNTTRYEHDRNNRLTKVIHPDGSFSFHVYDCCSEVVIHDENGNESYIMRDPLLNVKELTDKNGSVSRFDYDRAGDLIGYTDQLGRRFTVGYDSAARPNSWTNARGETVRVDRDPLGGLKSVTNEKGAQTTFDRDANRRLTRIIDPLGKNQDFSWNPAGLLASITNNRSNEIGFTYDADGRIISKSYDRRPIASYRYDANGNLIQISSAEETTVYQYNTVNKLTMIRYYNGLEISMNYDPVGNISDIRYPNGLLIRYSYDNRNRVSDMSWGHHSIRYRYDAMNNILNEARSNGTASEYVYNSNNEFTEITHTKNTDILTNIKYKRDVIGNVITESGIFPLESTPTDSVLKSTYNNADQIEVHGAEHYTYDADGNLVTIDNGKWQALYNAENQLIELNRDGQKTSYSYNGLNQRTGRVMGSDSRKFYYDNKGRLLFESDLNGKITATNIYAGGFLVARINATGENYFYHFDKTGNTLAMTDNDGKIVAAYVYSTFGAVTDRMGIEDNPFTYVGQFGVIDEGTGLFFMKNRFYDAITGRFIQKDPIGFDGGINQYAYVDNNPVKGIDPEGTACLEAALILAAVLAAGWWLACKFTGTNPWDKALNLPNVPPEERQAQAEKIGQEGKPYMGELIMGTGDKALSTNPLTSPGYSAIKAAHAAGEGDAVGVLRNAPCAPANNWGSAGTAANEAFDAYQANKNTQVNTRTPNR